MLSQLWRNSHSKEVPDGVRSVLTSRFHLDDDSIGKLKCYGKSGQYAGRQVRYLRLIDPTLLTPPAKEHLKYETLDNGTFKKSVLFEARLEKDGTAYLTDLRVRV